MPGSIKIDDGSGNYTILTNAGSLGSDKTLTIPNETATLATTTASNLGGLVLIETKTNDGTNSGLSFDNCFTSTYSNYKIITETTGSESLEARLRASSSDETTAAYGSIMVYRYVEGSTSTGVDRTTDGQQWRWAYQASGGSVNKVGSTNYVYGPQEATPTVFSGFCISNWNHGNSLSADFAGVYTNSTQYDGITILDSAGNNWTGQVSIYGIVE